MGKVYWFTAAAMLVVAGIVGWASASTTHARIIVPTAIVQVEPFQMMVNAKNLPIVEFKDYSLIFY
jgi:hypothetical protein